MTEETLSIKTIETALKEAAVIPLWGYAPAFPFEQLGSSLANFFEKKDFAIAPILTDWIGQDELLSGMGQDPMITPLALSPLPGEIFFIVPREGFAKVTSLLLSPEDMGFTDSLMRSGFYRVALLTALDCFNQASPYRDLMASLADEAPLPEGTSLAIDLSVTIDGNAIAARLVIPSGTQSSFQTHFAMQDAPILESKQAEHISVPLSFTVGNTRLSYAEWEKAGVGDCILLERCTYDGISGKGSALMRLGPTPLFDVRIKGDEVKILEQAYLEEEPSMTDTPKPPKEDLPPPEDMPSGSMEQESHLWEPGEQEAAAAKSAPNLLAKGEIPLDITVEIGRVQMPLEKVAKLKPGNVLNLSISAQSGVYLIVGGKQIAKGELVKLGDALGVKILKLSD